MPVYTYFDSPTKYQNPENYYDVGASPYLLERLLHHLEEQQDKLSIIYVALYLFNNKRLNDKLKELAAVGVQIQVVTIPADGYDDNRPAKIRDFETYETLAQATKYTLARRVFRDYFHNEMQGATLHWFPHKYIRSKSLKDFARGELPYSMRIKAILGINKDGSGFAGFSSSNFAVRDRIKEEYLVVVDNDSAMLASCAQFFRQLVSAAIPIGKFGFKGNYNQYQIETIPYPATDSRVGFTAPFYIDSNRNAEKALIAFINSAISVIKIAAQHVCPVAREVDTELTGGAQVPGNGVIADALLQQAARGVKIEIISQTTAAASSKDGTTFRSPANSFSFKKFYEQIRHVPNISYYVNENLHSKYIIADDKVLISSFNYTPSQFIYLDNVVIGEGEHQYRGIFSECGIYAVIDDESCVKAFKGNFDTLLENEFTKAIF